MNPTENSITIECLYCGALETVTGPKAARVLYLVQSFHKSLGIAPPPFCERVPIPYCHRPGCLDGHIELEP